MPDKKILELASYHYYCSYYKISDSQIKGEIKNHTEWYEYRIQKELK